MTVLHHDDDNEVREFPTSTPLVGEVGATITGGAGKVAAASTKTTSRAGGTNATTAIPSRNGNRDDYAYDNNNDNIDGGGVYYNADDLREQYKQALDSTNTTTPTPRQPPQPTLPEMMMKMVPPNNSGSGDADDHESDDHDDIKRKHQLYFGICCDMRIAVIALNSINIFVALMGWGVLLYWEGIFETKLKEENHEERVEEAEEEHVEFVEHVALLFVIICVTFGFMGMIGALLYNKCMITVASIWYCIQAFIAIVAGNILGILLSVSFVYPHYVLVQELSKGIITERNYHTDIRHCCCC